MINLKKSFSTTPYFDLMKDGISKDAPQVTEKIGDLHRRTYQSLRWAMLVITILLPIIFLVSAGWVDMQGSISAFYHTSMRNVFVGMLFAISICLFVYKGYNDFEDSALTTAGFYLLGVALFPTIHPDPNSGIIVPKYSYIIHYVCAYAFFGIIAIVCIYARENPYRHPKEFSKAYDITAALMIIVIVGAIILAFIDKVCGIHFQYSTFYLETSAVWIFARYWFLKGKELRGFE